MNRYWISDIKMRENPEELHWNGHASELCDERLALLLAFFLDMLQYAANSRICFLLFYQSVDLYEHVQKLSSTSVLSIFTLTPSSDPLLSPVLSSCPLLPTPSSSLTPLLLVFSLTLPRPYSPLLSFLSFWSSPLLPYTLRLRLAKVVKNPRIGYILAHG